MKINQWGREGGRGWWCSHKEVHQHRRLPSSALHSDNREPSSAPQPIQKIFSHFQLTTAIIFNLMRTSSRTIL